MAGLGNTGIKGFLASAKFTGQNIIKKGKELPEMVEHFLTGFAGYGWKIWEYTKDKFMLEIDSIRVRGTMTVYEQLIHKIRAVIGALAITQGQGKIKTVALSPDQSEYVITVEGDMSFVEGDFIRCQTWTGEPVKMYHVKIDRITDNANIHVLIEEFDYSFDEFSQLVVENPPEVADEIVQFGNALDTTRQSAIYIHTDESGQPTIDVMFGINSKDWTDCVKIRIGGNGFFVENGMIKGTDSMGDTTYCIYPDGTAEFGDESVVFNPDKSGHLAGGAISWYWDDNLGKYTCVMDDVILTNAYVNEEEEITLEGGDISGSMINLTLTQLPITTERFDVFLNGLLLSRSLLNISGTSLSIDLTSTNVSPVIGDVLIVKYYRG